MRRTLPFTLKRFRGERGATRRRKAKQNGTLISALIFPTPMRMPNSSVGITLPIAKRDACRHLPSVFLCCEACTMTTMQPAGVSPSGREISPMPARAVQTPALLLAATDQQFMPDHFLVTAAPHRQSGPCRPSVACDVQNGEF